MFVLTFAMKLKDGNCENHWNILVRWDQWKMISDLNMSHEKMFDFVSLALLEFTSVIKLRNFGFESHWNTSIFFIKMYMTSDLNVSWKNVWFCFISIVWVHFSHKTGKFRLRKSLIYFNSFLIKKMMSDLSMSCQIVSDLV